MYIFELIYNVTKKLFNKKAIKQNKNIQKKSENNEEPVKCEHVFLPVDSTKKILACTKCGILIKTENLKSKIKKKSIDTKQDNFKK